MRIDLDTTYLPSHQICALRLILIMLICIAMGLSCLHVMATVSLPCSNLVLQSDRVLAGHRLFQDLMTSCSMFWASQVLKLPFNTVARKGDVRML